MPYFIEDLVQKIENASAKIRFQKIKVLSDKFDIELPS